MSLRAVDEDNRIKDGCSNHTKYGNNKNITFHAGGMTLKINAHAVYIYNNSGVDDGGNHALFSEEDLDNDAGFSEEEEFLSNDGDLSEEDLDNDAGFSEEEEFLSNDGDLSEEDLDNDAGFSKEEEFLLNDGDLFEEVLPNGAVFSEEEEFLLNDGDLFEEVLPNGAVFSEEEEFLLNDGDLFEEVLPNGAVFSEEEEFLLNDGDLFEEDLDNGAVFSEEEEFLSNDGDLFEEVLPNGAVFSYEVLSNAPAALIEVLSNGDAGGDGSNQVVQMEQAIEACVGFGQDIKAAAEYYHVPLAELLDKVQQHREDYLVDNISTINSSNLKRQHDLDLDEEIEHCFRKTKLKSTEFTIDVLKMAVKESIDLFGKPIMHIADKFKVSHDSLYYHLKKVPSYLKRKDKQRYMRQKKKKKNI
ncbi:uncharacterized protein isoform X2 [Musca autumnalis]|uniref:uncharacterized protein isoform X2 n=1 Tax=Musca autumnalis TaxID=221902 RepID=UPI003CEE8992